MNETTCVAEPISRVKELDMAISRIVEIENRLYDLNVRLGFKDGKLDGRLTEPEKDVVNLNSVLEKTNGIHETIDICHNLVSSITERL